MLLQFHHSGAAGVSTLYKRFLKQPEALSKKSSLNSHPSNTLVYCIPVTELPQWLRGKESTCNTEAARDMGSIPGWRRSLGRGHGNPAQYSCLEIPWEEPGSLKSMGTERVGHDRSDLACNTLPRFQLQSQHTCVKVLTLSESPWFSDYPSIVDHQCLSQRSPLKRYNASWPNSDQVYQKPSGLTQSKKQSSCLAHEAHLLSELTSCIPSPLPLELPPGRFIRSIK